MKKLIGYSTKDSMYDGDFDSIVGWKAAGMGYVIKTDNGKTIVVDGGDRLDADPFYNLLLNNSENGKVNVDYWIITHPHGDHYYCLLEMSKRKNVFDNVTVKNIVYMFPEDFCDKNGNTCKADIENMELVKKLMGADEVTPNTEEPILIDGVRVDFLFVPKDCTDIDNANGLSLIFTVEADKRIMFTGDAFVPSLKNVSERYRKLLKSDILQMPHHALCDTGYLDFFKYVDAHTVMLPTCIAGYRAMRDNDEYKRSNLANKFAEDNAHTVYKAFEGAFEIFI